MVFFNNKNINIKRSYKKLNNKKFNLFKVKAKVEYFYRLKLPSIIRIFNIFYTKLLTLVIIDPLLG